MRKSRAPTQVAGTAKRSRGTALVKSTFRKGDVDGLKVPRYLGFDKMKRIKHRYVEIVPMNVGAGTGISSYIFSCNGMYDPNITGTGHQPLYFDQLAALYNHYCVVSATCTAKLVFASAAQNVATRFVGFINDNTGYPSSATLNVIEEQSTASFAISTVNNKDPLVIRLKWNAKDYFGNDPLDNTELQGTSGSNPTEQSYFALGAIACDAVTPVDVFVHVTITYDAVWKEPIDVLTS